MQKECDNCGSTDFVGTEVSSVGVGGPDLLPGTGSFHHASFTIQGGILGSDQIGWDIGVGPN